MPYVAVQTEALKLCPKEVISFHRCLTFITECYVTKKALKLLATNAEVATKMEVGCTDLFNFFLCLDGLSQGCRKYSLQVF